MAAIGNEDDATRIAARVRALLDRPAKPARAARGRRPESPPAVQVEAVALDDSTVVLVRLETPPLPSRSASDGPDRIAELVLGLPGELGNKLDVVEAAVVTRAIAVCHGNRSAAARLLGVDRKTLIRRWAKARRLDRSACPPATGDSSPSNA